MKSSIADDAGVTLLLTTFLFFSCWMFSVSCHQLLATSPTNSAAAQHQNPFFHFAFPVIPSTAAATEVHYAFPQMLHHPSAVIPGPSSSSAPCQRELQHATQRLDETILTLQNVRNDVEAVKAVSQDLAKTMVNIWIMTTTNLDESLRRSAEMSQLLSDSNNKIIQLQNDLNETQKDLADTKATVEYLTAELRANTSPSSIGRMPSSCADLQATGYKTSGLFSILGNRSIDSVYCDFTKSSNDTEFQVFIGSTNVQSRPTYFYAQKNNSFSSMDVPIPFEMERVNSISSSSGGAAASALDLASGTFTAPRSGTYYFSFTGLAEFPASVAFVYLEVRLFLNGLGVGSGHSSKSSATEYQFNQVALQSTLALREGDRIWLQITGMSDGVFLYDAADIHHTHFSGFLLQEDFS